MIQPAVFRWLKDFYNTSVPHLWFEPAEWFIVTSNGLMFTQRTLPTTKKKKKSCKTFENGPLLGEWCTELLYLFTRKRWMWLDCFFPPGWLQRWLSLSGGAQLLQVQPSCMAGIRLTEAFVQFLGTFGVNRLFQGTGADLGWAATQLKPGHVVSCYLFIQQSQAQPSKPWIWLSR